MYVIKDPSSLISMDSKLPIYTILNYGKIVPFKPTSSSLTLKRLNVYVFIAELSSFGVANPKYWESSETTKCFRLLLVSKNMS